MLIQGASLLDGSIVDARLANGQIQAIGNLPTEPGEITIEANGGLLLPGLHDHHIHLLATAAARQSIQCGPPTVRNLEDLGHALKASGSGWMRGVGYQESIAGMLDRQLLDRLQPNRPLRIQHRSGRMWFLNTCAMGLLLAGREAPPGLDQATGQLFDSDAWLRIALDSHPPDLFQLSQELSRRGVTGATDMSPANDSAAARLLAESAMTQKLHLAGRLDLELPANTPRMALGPAKIHLHEAQLPDLDSVLGFIAAAHTHHRPVAIHCVTEVELVFALSALREALVLKGDRIEHGSVTPDTALSEIVGLGLHLCVQPHFIHERGDNYLAEVEAELHPLLYRLRSFRDAGVPMAGGSDAPYGGTDPWTAMAASVSRQTRNGQIIGANEALTPEQALDLYLRAPDDLSSTRHLKAGEPADLCLLDRNWNAARNDLAAVQVVATFVDGQLIHNGVDQPPSQGDFS